MLFNKLRKILRFSYMLLKYDTSIEEWFNFSTNSVISIKAKLMGSYNISFSTIGDYTYIAQKAHISYATIGKYCSIGPNFLCGWGIHPINGISTSPMFYSTAKQNGFSFCNITKVEERKRIIIENDVFIGANVTVLDGVRIGNGAVIGAGATVSKDIPPYAVAVGSPIRIIKYRFSEPIIHKLERCEWWNKDDSVLPSIEKNFFDVESFLDEIDNLDER